MNKTTLISNIQQTTDLQFPLSTLSTLTPADKYLLHETMMKIRPGSKNYEDSWGYIIQATRNNGFKWYDPYTGFLIFFGYKPNDNKTLVVASYFADLEYFAHSIARVKEALKVKKVIIKNVNPPDVAFLVSYGFRPYKSNEGWDKVFRFDDQTFPQQLVDLSKLSVAKGPQYHKLRQSLNKHNPMIFFRKYTKEDYPAVLDLFAQKDGNTFNSIERNQGMYFSSHSMYPNANIDKFVIQHKITKEIVGFTATSDISSLYTSLVASIFKVNIKVESVWGIYQTLITKYQSGFNLVNLGGCETEGTYIFLKRRFRPSEEQKKTHLVYDL
jgi:hypothetical protein